MFEWLKELFAPQPMARSLTPEEQEELRRQQEEEEERGRQYNRELRKRDDKRAKELIKNFDEWTLSEVADVLGWSQSQFINARKELWSMYKDGDLMLLHLELMQHNEFTGFDNEDYEE